MKMCHFIIIFLFIVSSCVTIHKDEERFDFINQLLENPESINKIIKQSKYYDGSKTNLLDDFYLPKMVNYINTYFKNEKYQVIYDSIKYIPKSDYFKEGFYTNEINIICKEKRIYFEFYLLNDNWILKSIDNEWSYLIKLKSTIDIKELR